MSHDKYLDRRVASILALFWVMMGSASYLWFGFDRWITRILVAVAIGFLSYAVYEFVRFRIAVEESTPSNGA